MFIWKGVVNSQEIGGAQCLRLETVHKTDAYVYFYPVVENLKTLFLSSVWPHTSSYRGAPNVFHHATDLVDYTFTGVVSPNNDTLYSSAWLDLDEQPLILGLPDVTVVSSGKVFSNDNFSMH